MPTARFTPSFSSMTMRRVCALVTSFRLARPERGPQERLGGTPAPPAALVHVEVGVAEVVAAVEFLDLRDAGFLGRVAPRVEDLPLDARLLDAELAVAAVVLGGAAEVALGTLEVRQRLVPAQPRLPSDSQ
jgi:hypothetical protein